MFTCLLLLTTTTGYAINPARDFGPRTFTAMAGYGRAVYNFRHQYWIWCPVIGPVCGAIGELRPHGL